MGDGDPACGDWVSSRDEWERMGGVVIQHAGMAEEGCDVSPDVIGRPGLDKFLIIVINWGICSGGS